jgi:hypothetical protein
MTKLIVAFRNFPNAPKNIPLGKKDSFIFTKMKVRILTKLPEVREMRRFGNLPGHLAIQIFRLQYQLLFSVMKTWDLPQGPRIFINYSKPASSQAI